MSAIVDRWDRRENQMIAVLTQAEGNVTVTDGLEVDHQIPSFPSLQAEVGAMVDELTGSVAGVRDIATHVTALANAADESASAAASSASASSTSADASEQSNQSALQHEQAADASAIASETSRQESDRKSQASAASAAGSALSASHAFADANRSAAEADDSASSASAALVSLGEANDARDLAQAWATSPENTEVASGGFSAMHWAIKAQQFATGSLVYLGSWDASGNALPSGAKKGAFYKISGQGTVNGVTYRVGDNIVHNGTDWDLIDNTESVTAVAGKVGNVTLNITDIVSLSNALDGKAAINHSHAIADVVGLQTALDSKASNATVAGKAALVHTHAIADVSGLQSALDSKVVQGIGVTFAGVTSNATTAFAGGLGSLPAGQWAQYTLLYGSCQVSNNDQIRLGMLRTSAGSSWANCAWRLQRTVDSTAMGYIQLGDDSNTGSDALILNSTGAQLRMQGGVNRFTGDLTTNAWMYAANFKLNSDLRLKKQRAILDGREQLENIRKLIPLFYRKEGLPEYGFGAQHVRNVYPTMVSEYDGPLGEGTLTLSVGELIAPLVAAVQELDRRLTEAGH
ncbi:tail fiber domain-containing protein [Luteibacter sp. 22Crub2.1]|uniref:tail fiber domain-containing protein n=1 Tax=Luteibacter sp. 22Crub2.1 TaxID=1283288 RepID=UPI0009A73550|nr:tail fiber domain-containing protein [Luteibacter sp. 22Crub2.1]SKB50757.1 Phage tail repeat like [Luteibacter sp. 22Crub2.1]